MRSERNAVRELSVSAGRLEEFRTLVLRRAAKALDARFGPVYGIDRETGRPVNVGMWLGAVYPVLGMDQEPPKGKRRKGARADRCIVDEMSHVQQRLAWYAASNATIVDAMTRMDEETPHDPTRGEAVEAVGRARKELAAEAAEGPSAAPAVPEPYLCPQCGHRTEYRAFSGGREWDCTACPANGAYPSHTGPRAALIQTEQGRRTLRTVMRQELERRRKAREE